MKKKTKIMLIIIAILLISASPELVGGMLGIALLVMFGGVLVGLFFSVAMFVMERFP